jgi:hypothetical protein
MAKVKALRSDGYYTATFLEPAFAFIQEPLRLYEQVYRVFASSNLRPEDVRIEPRRDPQDFLMTCALLDIGATVRFRLRNAEVWSADSRVLGNQSTWSSLVHGVSQACRAMLVTSELPAVVTSRSILQKHTFILGTHWELQDSDYSSWLRRWLPQAPDGMTANGFAFLSEGDGRSAIVQAERSAWFTGPANGWARIVCDLDGTVSESDACNIANLQIELALKAIGLDFEPAP